MSRNTIQIYLNAYSQDESKYRHKAKPTQLTRFHQTLTQTWELDVERKAT